MRLLPWSSLARYHRLVAEAGRSGRLVHIDNAYVDVCDLPYLPCNGSVDGFQCPFKRRVLPGSGRCYRVSTQDLYLKSRLNIFVSPLHRRTIAGLLGEGTVEPSFILRPIVDSAKFRRRPETERDIPLLFVGSFVEAKGSQEVIQRWPMGDVRVVGPPTPDALAYPGYVGPVGHAEMPSLMERSQKLVVRPRWPEPFGLAAAEGVLSGCALDTNDRVGALSFEVDLGEDALYDDATGEFWRRLEALIA
jgi:hypothetical protein